MYNDSNTSDLEAVRTARQAMLDWLAYLQGLGIHFIVTPERELMWQWPGHEDEIDQLDRIFGDPATYQGLRFWYRMQWHIMREHLNTVYDESDTDNTEDYEE